MLTRKHIKEFHDNGFIVVRKFLRKKDINNIQNNNTEVDITNAINQIIDKND